MLLHTDRRPKHTSHLGVRVVRARIVFVARCLLFRLLYANPTLLPARQALTRVIDLGGWLIMPFFGS